MSLVTLNDGVIENEQVVVGSRAKRNKRTSFEPVSLNTSGGALSSRGIKIVLARAVGSDAVSHLKMVRLS